MIPVDDRGEILELSDTINLMVERSGPHGAEMTRVARKSGIAG
jgi:hypothetical protein